jgi:flagellar basal-body rod protein FlgF
MENGILITLSRQRALSNQMDMIAHNLANANTIGFKRSRMLFAQHLMPARPQGAEHGSPLFVRDVATRLDPTEGGLETTGNPLDVAIRGDGYLTVQTPEGERYTRNGHLRLDDTGQLVTGNGLTVLDDRGQPIRIDANEGEISVAIDGTISTSAGDVARLGVVRFADPEVMKAAGEDRFAADGRPEPVARPMIVQGMLEQSNVSPVLEIEGMIRVHRAYDGAKTLIDREDERIRKMMQAYVA